MDDVETSAIKSAQSEQGSTAPGAPLVPARWGRIYLAVEFFFIFVAGPILLYVYRHTLSVFLIPSILILTAACTLLLLRDPLFDRRMLLGFDGFYSWLKRLPWTFFPGAIALTTACAVFRPDLLFAFPRNNTWIWLLVMVLYPLLSALPQEIIYRTFFFHRYQRLFRSDFTMTVMSSLCFGLAHLFFANWIAPVLATVGGVIFSRTYARTCSTFVVSLEHSLWGNFIFTVGLGWYFFTGSIPV